MLKTLNDVVANNYVNHFEEISKFYNIEGAYVKYYSSQTHQDEIFFVCGLDKDKVHSIDINVESILANQQKKYLIFNPHIAVFKITGSEPLLTHQEVVDYCQTTEFLTKLYQENNMHLPDLIPKGIVSGLKMAHQNATNPALTPEERKAYLADVKRAIKKQDELYTNHGHNCNKTNFHLYQQYDTQKSKIANWAKRIFSRNKNRVSMEHLIVSCKEVTTVGVHISDYSKVQDKLRKHPEILYWMSDKPIGQKISCPNNQGYGSQKANDQRYIAFSFDSEYCPDFMAIVNQVEHPDAYQTTVENLISRYAYIQHISILADEYDKYISAINSRGIKYCIDDTSSDPGIINLVMASDFKQSLSGILEKISLENERKHLYLSLEDRKQNAQEDFLTGEKAKLETDILSRAKTMMGPDIEIISVSGNLLHDLPSNIHDDEDISF